MNDSPVTAVESFRFLGTIIAQDLKWEQNICSLIKTAQERMFFLRQLKKFNLPKTMMDKGRLQRVIRSAEKVIGCNRPSLHDLHASRTLRRAWKIVADPSPLPSGRRLRSIRTKTSRHLNSFFPSATGLLNKARPPH
ncbi:hypothetical protein OYC64_000198 [Pagothenia borchgrevinki]|uniref:Alkylated DNA repair protein AlkB homologue 8 N-terminal domain-containing protein n=1 Tax=Pagothenia borchgrevinki TaxID=8213 RepID=A0ABD2HFI7_PAGBO